MCVLDTNVRVSFIFRKFEWKTLDEKTELISDSKHTAHHLSVSAQIHTPVVHFHPSLKHFPVKVPAQR